MLLNGERWHVYWGRQMKFQIKAAGAIAGLFLLAGCSGYELARAQMIEPQGSSFDRSLYHGYVGLAESEYAEGDYRDSDSFALRATRVAEGGAVEPEEIGDRMLPADHVAEMTDARNRLLAALAAGASEADPERAAEAQVYFDCWMQEQEENWQSEDIAACRDRFMAALDALEPALAARQTVQPVRFVVYFKTDKFELDEEAEAIIAEAQAAAAKLGTPIVKVSGNADTVGSSDYNQSLSEMRAQAVAKVLGAGDVPVRALVTEGYGELAPAVATPDETAEQQNRRVEIILEP